MDTHRKLQLMKLPQPPTFNNLDPVMLTQKTMNDRLAKIIKRMKQNKLDILILYADKEHGSNFEYLTGFIPRFEEALLILNQNGSAHMLLGNENLKMAQHARIQTIPIHIPYFSLPNQPMEHEVPLSVIFTSIGLHEANTIGIVGWKLFTSSSLDNTASFDLPHYIVDALLQIRPKHTTMLNATALFIDACQGARACNNVNEIAHYEWSANLASNCILNAMNAINIGKNEMEIAQHLSIAGQPHNVVIIAAAGKRFMDARIYPRHKQIQLKDSFAMTTGFKGGLSSRVGYIAYDESDLDEPQKDYLERVVFPYYRAIVCWLEEVHIGMRGHQVYEMIETILPKDRFHWTLNPGHLTADEEWMSSPIYQGSQIILTNGMLFQIDIIPSVQGYAGVSAEECVVLADEQMKKDIKTSYPDMWDRIMQRKTYLRDQLHIILSEDLLPMSNTVAYLRPFLLNKEKAICCI